MASITDTYTIALRHHRAGEVNRAENLYREILRFDPNHADANHLLGVTAHQQNNNDLAVEYIARAIHLDPSVASYHSNLGAAYRALGRLDSAVESLRNAVRADADYVEGHENLCWANRENTTKPTSFSKGRSNSNVLPIRKTTSGRASTRASTRFPSAEAVMQETTGRRRLPRATSNSRR